VYPVGPYTEIVDVLATMYAKTVLGPEVLLTVS
jgi:hypothetical protein